MQRKALFLLVLTALASASGQAVAATLYSLGVDGTLTGPSSGTYTGAGDGSLVGDVMSYSHTGNILVDGGFEVSVTYTGTFDLVSETGSAVASDCVFVSGFANLCDSLIQDVPIALTVSSVSATQGSPIVVVADDGQAEFTHTFTQVIPLPATVWLFGSALGILGWVRRKL